MRSRVALILLLAGLAASAVVARVVASGPVFWTVSTAADLLAGRSEGAYVSLDGVVTAGPRLASRLTSTPAQVWSLARSADGALWAGTGGEGHVLRLRPGQPEERVFDADESNIFAVAIAGSRVFAASSPDGRVTVIEPDGTSRAFFDPGEKYIWALAVDGDGRLWVGAGTPAVVYRVDPAGRSEVVYRPPSDHVVSLAALPDGRMLAGTESPGRLYRFDPAGRPFVLLDSGLTELRAAAVAPDGVIFAAAVARGDASPSAGEATSAAVTTATPDRESDAEPATPSRRSVVYRIDPDGQWEAIWESPDVIYDLAADENIAVFAAAGPSGRLYRIDRRREVLLFTGVDARQITRFVRAPGAGGLVAFATANPGRVVTIGDGVQSPATYFSSVRDTKSVATWGLIRWDATGPVTLSTRSGNTREPDDSWSPWSAPLTRPAGEAVTSPAARFVQWRAELGAGSPAAALRSVTLAYLPRNGRPLVASVTVHPPGVVFQRPFSGDDGAIAGLDDATAAARRPPGDPGPPTPSPGRRLYQKGLQTLQWKAEDPDGDRLTYALQYRRDGDPAWHDLRRDLADTIFVWDTTAMADGRYVVRVLASDAASNAADRALTGERDSAIVPIDNTPPDVTVEVTRQGGAARLVVRVIDAQSPIEKVEYSLGGGPWQLVYPADGLADSPDERYEIALAVEADAGRIVIRATDRLQNITSRAAAGR